jgi:hypothetical protein
MQCEGEEVRIVHESAGGVPSGPDFAEISVDIERLLDFACMLREENEANLEPYAVQIISHHSRGVSFGWTTLSNEVRATRDVYGECLHQSVAALQSYIETSRFLVDAIEEVATRYEQVDALAAERADQVAAELQHEWDLSAYQQKQAEDAARIEAMIRRQQRYADEAGI